MTTGNGGDVRSSASNDLVRQLRIFNGEIERYVLRMSHRHSMHRTDLAAIAMVMDHGGASPTEISAALNLSPSATSAMLDRLERAGHVRRERLTSDRRAVRVEVTDTALAVGASMFGLLASHMRSALDGYDEDELTRMAGLMQRLNAAARRASDEASPVTPEA